jgi:hypothetical protein
MSNGFQVHDEGRSGAETTLTGPLSNPVAERPRVRFSLPAQHWRVRLLGALVAAVCAVVSFALLMGLTASPSHAGSGSSHAAAASGFSHLPQPCALLSASTVAEYLPGATCEPDAAANPGMAGSNADWTPTTGSPNGSFGGDVEVGLMSPPSVLEGVFDQMKSMDAMPSTGQTVRDSRPVAGLGDEAYIVFKTDGGTATTFLIVDDENAQIDISYDMTVVGQAPSQTWAEAAVLAMARDVIKGLR